MSRICAVCRPMLAKARLVRLHQAHLPDRGGGLQLVHRAAAASSSRGASCLRRSRPLETSTTSRPARAARRSARPSARARAWSSPRPSLVTRLRADLDDEAPAPWRVRCVMSFRPRRRVRRIRHRGSRRRCGILVATARRLARRARCLIAKMSSRQPSPLSAEIANTGPFQPKRFTNAARAASRSSAGMRSSLFSTSQRGLSTAPRRISSAR